MWAGLQSTSVGKPRNASRPKLIIGFQPNARGDEVFVKWKPLLGPQWVSFKKKKNPSPYPLVTKGTAPPYKRFDPALSFYYLKRENTKILSRPFFWGHEPVEDLSRAHVHKIILREWSTCPFYEVRQQNWLTPFDFSHNFEFDPIQSRPYCIKWLTEVFVMIILSWFQSDYPIVELFHGQILVTLCLLAHTCVEHITSLITTLIRSIIRPFFCQFQTFIMKRRMVKRGANSWVKTFFFLDR